MEFPIEIAILDFKGINNINLFNQFSLFYYLGDSYEDSIELCEFLF